MTRLWKEIGVLTVLLLFIATPGKTTRPYWQQDVSYKIEVRLAEDGRTLLGHLKFRYRNNSPDTLTELRFHAPYNSFQPGSPADRRWKARDSFRIENASADDYGSLIVKHLRDGQGRAITPLFNYSIFKVPLPEPLVPGDSVALKMDFESYIPGANVAYRSSFSHGQLKVAHWYPQVCVYDPVVGWEDNQYLGTGEAYGEFGIYDVSLSLPEPFIVGATGVLMNRAEMIPDSLRWKLDLADYANWRWGTPPDTIFGNWSRFKTWRFHAENVHDFAWVADPQFRIDQTRCGSTDIWILARQEHASGWQDAAEVTRQGMEILEREMGPFPYPEFTVVDCFSGMEYPGIVFCGGRSPSYKLLFWHEMTHNYFMGALGSNQTDRPFMDEGFTTYWEIRIMEELLGEDNVQVGQRGSSLIMDKDRWRRGLRPYIQRQKSGYILPMLIESDLPDVYMQYRVSAYYKPASMLFALQSYVGKEGIRQIMHDYYRNWKFRHPYETDFFRSAEETLGTSLEWFYDAWMRDSKTLDYSLSRIRTEAPEYIALRVERKGDMILPVTVGVQDQAGNWTNYYIPLDEEPTPPGCDVRLPRWDQRRDPYRRYVFEVKKEHCKKATLDPQGLLGDINPLNNTTSLLPPCRWEFDAPYPHISPVDVYRMRWAPTAFYNGVDGLQAGAYFKGDYLERWSKLDMGLRIGALTGRVSADLAFEDDFPSLGRSTFWGFTGFYQEGFQGGRLYLRHDQKKGFDERILWRGTMSFSFDKLFDRNYPRDPELWETGRRSALTVDAAMFPKWGRWRFSVSTALETAAPPGDFRYSKISSEITTATSWSDLDFSVRGFWGSASDGTPVQDWFGLGGGGPLLQEQSRWLRARGTLPSDWNVRVSGDGNLRGYASPEYLAKNVWSGQLRLGWKMNFLRGKITGKKLPPRFRPHITSFLFAGTGIVSNTWDRFRWDEHLDDAGMGLTILLPSGSGIEIAFPLYISDPPPDENRWKWRWELAFLVK